MLRRILIIITSVCVIACGKYDIDMSKYLNVDYDLKCIWDKAPHCAFTSLIEFNGKFYCCFREANAHLPYRNGGYGIIRILESSDGNDWYSVCVIEDSKYDLRDPYMCVTPDNRLMLICGRLVVDNMGNRIIQPSKVCFFDSAQSIRDAVYEAYNISIENNKNYSSYYWLWKVKWHNGIAYGVAYNNTDAPILVQSIDGVNFNIVTGFDVSVNEADIEFINDNMVVVSRAVDQTHNGYIGYSNYPYEDWSWKDLNHFIQCPELLALNDNIILLGRGANGTTIYNVGESAIYPILIMPSDGDNGYPGTLYDQVSSELLISYYTTLSTTRIYLAKIPVADIL